MISSHRNLKYNAWTNYEIELILNIESEVSDENHDETYGEEDDITEQAPILPCCRVYK